MKTFTIETHEITTRKKTFTVEAESIQEARIIAIIKAREAFANDASEGFTDVVVASGRQIL